MERVLDIKTAVDLSTLITAAIHSHHVMWSTDGGNTVWQSRAQRICNGDGEVLYATDDVRDAYLQVIVHDEQDEEFDGHLGRGLIQKQEIKLLSISSMLNLMTEALFLARADGIFPELRAPFPKHKLAWVPSKKDVPSRFCIGLHCLGSEQKVEHRGGNPGRHYIYTHGATR